jgi:hypothetical protein
MKLKAFKDLRNMYDMIKEDQAKGEKVLVDGRQVPDNITKDQFGKFIAEHLDIFKTQLHPAELEDYVIQILRDFKSR